MVLTMQRVMMYLLVQVLPARLLLPATSMVCPICIATAAASVLSANAPFLAAGLAGIAAAKVAQGQKCERAQAAARALRSSMEEDAAGIAAGCADRPYIAPRTIHAREQLPMTRPRPRPSYHLHMRGPMMGSWDEDEM